MNDDREEALSWFMAEVGPMLDKWVAERSPIYAPYVNKEMLMKDQSAKADGGKTRPNLLQHDLAIPLRLVQAVFDYGEQKYSHLSWQKVEQDRWDEAQRRHQQKIDLNLSVFDDESGLLHRAHQIGGLLIMLHNEFNELMIQYDLTYEQALEKFTTFNPPPQDHKVKAPTGDNSDVEDHHCKGDSCLTPLSCAERRSCRLLPPGNQSGADD